MVKEMPIPPGATQADKAQEILRVWVVGMSHEMHISIDVMAFPDSRAWGVALADLARHVANSYEALAVAPAPKVLDSIAKQFALEVEKPTSDIATRKNKPV